MLTKRPFDSSNSALALLGGHSEELADTAGIVGNPAGKHQELDFATRQQAVAFGLVATVEVRELDMLEVVLQM